MSEGSHFSRENTNVRYDNVLKMINSVCYTVRSDYHACTASWSYFELLSCATPIMDQMNASSREFASEPPFLKRAVTWWFISSLRLFQFLGATLPVERSLMTGTRKFRLQIQEDHSPRFGKTIKGLLDLPSFSLPHQFPYPELSAIVRFSPTAGLFI